MARTILDVELSLSGCPQLRELDGNNHQVYHAHGDGYNHVVKFCRTPGFKQKLSREIKLLQWLAEHTSAPVPELTAHDRSEAIVPAPYLVMPYLGELTPGSGLTDISHDALRSLGSALGQLHSQAKCDGFGVPAVSAADRITGPQESWAETLDTVLQGHLGEINGTPFEDIGERIYSHFDRERSVFERVSDASLMHNDLNPTNVRFASESVDTILDWERSLCGHSLYDLCKTELMFFEGPDVCVDDSASQFYDGYRRVRHLGEEFERYQRLYRPILFLEPMATFDVWAPDLKQERAAVVRQLKRTAEAAMAR